MPRRLRPSLDWLLVLVPITAVLHFTGASPTWTFFCACGAIVPLAGWIGRATEDLAATIGDGPGALLNATFGNAAELIIGWMALRHGLIAVVKASLTGSILGNVLLVLGAAILAGGVRHQEQRFNRSGARSQATMLLLAAIGLVMPAAYHHFGGRRAALFEGRLSLAIAGVLLATYALGLWFSLHTHKELFAGCGPPPKAPAADEGRSPMSRGRALAVLLGATAVVAWLSEVLVGTVEAAAHALGMSDIFIGIIVVAIAGNAAEHATAVILARKNRMDLALGIALGSSIQIALVVAPLLVIASHFIGAAPMDLVFSAPEVIAVVVAVLLAAQIAGDGESNWLEGVQLLAVYVILAIVFYFFPG
jgi:Ca2+:H+ antiporter